MLCLRKYFNCLIGSSTMAMLLIATQLHASVTWPSSQLLPSFPAPAQTQDLITFPAVSTNWPATGPNLQHNTGHNDGDGWLCQTGIDAPNAFMIYGPYDTNVPVGNNTANFSIKIDNNTADNNPQITLDVHDYTTGQVLATQTITRQQFSAASTYVNFSLPFNLATAGDSLEYRVYWLGGAYIKVSQITVNQNTGEDLVLFSSLKGIVNLTQPRIFSYEGDAFAEGPYTWLTSLGYNWNQISDNWSLISKYRSELSGIIVYDTNVIDTVNLANTLAGSKRALVASPSQVARLTAAPYNLPILMDLRGQFTTKLQVYQTLFNQYWPSLTHRVIFGLDPNNVKGAVREYETAVGGAAIWLDPRVSAESALQNQFLSSMGAGRVYMGWWPDEGTGVTAASQYGIATVASDYSTNLTFHSGTSRAVVPKPTPPTPVLQNKIYVAFILSDGDNLQFVEHLQRKLWSNADRGKVPIGWTVSPAMLDAMPGAMNYLWSTATDNDELLSGPSGYGYTYPNIWSDQNQLNQFVTTTDDYTRRAGLRVVTVWNTITGGISQNTGQTYANYAPALLGLTAQNTGGGLTIYNNKMPGQAFDCNYCATANDMKNAIASAAANWDHNSPKFILIQAQPWNNVTPTDFMNVANSLSSDYLVVRPDHLFELLRERNGLPADPPQ